VNYRDPDASDEIRAVAPHGVDIVIEVAPATNADLDAAVLASDGTVAVYASERDRELQLDVGTLMARNIRYQFVLAYTVSAAVKDQSVADVAAAVADGALPVGADAGLPLHRFPLEHTADARDTVEHGAVRKVLIDLSS
jgi:NADPH2:quinone reductase